MSEPATPNRPFYVAGGTLRPGEPCYVERRADAELFESLLAGEYCYVLTARQMGKSSLMARTAKRLEEAGVRSAIVDLTQIGSEREAQAAAQWYFGIANRIHQQLGITEPLRPWWQERSDLSSVQRLTDFFREIVLVHCPGRIVIFVDEIDSTISLPFADDFFAALRACFNARATEPAFERLTFVLLGVATPDQLIQDSTRTPFNIGKKIDLTDFSVEEARTLASGLHADPEEAERSLERVLHWTGGHPYLTQAVCRAVREKDRDGTEEVVDPLVQELFLTSRAQREETNLKHARARLEKEGVEGRRLLQLYRRVRQGKVVPDQPTSPLFAQLKLAGVVKATDEGRLAVRNRIYETVFTPEWAKAAMPADRGRQFAAASLAASLLGLLVWYAVFQPRSYEEAFRAAIRDDGYNSAFQAYTALRANPFYRSRATELMQKFWEKRSLRYALVGKRDESLLSYLQGLTLKDSEKLRRRAGNLVGSDYERLRLTLRHDGQVRSVAFSPDGNTLATGSSDNVRLWDLRSETPTILQHKDGPILVMAFSSDGQTLATGSFRAVRLWDARSRRLIAPPRLLEESLFLATFSPDLRTIATAPYGTVRLWDTRSGKLLIVFEKHFGLAVPMAFSPDGRILATGGDAVRFWDARLGELLAPPSQPQSPVIAVAFSFDGRTLVTGSRDDTVWLWDTRSRKPIVPALQHHRQLNALALSPDELTLATASEDETVRLWDAPPRAPIASPLVHQNPDAIALSPDGRVIAIRFNGTIHILDARSRSPLAPPLRHQKPVISMVFSPDGRTLATGAGGTVRLWDARSGKPITLLLQQESYGSTMAFSADSRILATGSLGDGVRFWGARSGKPITFALQHKGAVLAIAFSPDGRTFATASVDKTVQLWDIHSGQFLTPRFQLPDKPQTVAFMPNGKGFFVATNHLLNTFSWDGKEALLLNSQLLNGFWKQGYRFSSDCERCLQVVLSDPASSFRIETLHLDEPIDPPIEGDPKELLKKWQHRLGLRFDEQMRPVPL